MRIAEFMHAEVVTVTSGTLISEAQKIMDEHKIRRLPVVDKAMTSRHWKAPPGSGWSIKIVLMKIISMSLIRQITP